MTTREQVVQIARSWVGTPWKHQASLKGVGSDCGGLIRGVAVEAHLLPADYTSSPEWAPYRGYGRQPSGDGLLSACATLFDPVETRAYQVADILLMRFEGDPQHVAIVSARTPHPYIVHAYLQARRVVENRLDAIWASRIVAAYSFRGLTA